MRKLLSNTFGSIPLAMTSVIGLLIAIIIGVMIWYKIDASLAGATTFTALPAGARAAWNSTNTTANSVWALAPVIGLVVIAGVIIATILMFAGGKQV